MFVQNHNSIDNMKNIIKQRGIHTILAKRNEIAEAFIGYFKFTIKKNIAQGCRTRYGVLKP